MLYINKISFEITIILLCTGLVVSECLNAKQVYFDKQITRNFIEYKYSFFLPSGQKQKLKFRLDRLESEASKELFSKVAKRKLTERTRKKAESLFNTLQANYIQQARNEFDIFINEQARRLPAGISIQNLNKGENIRARSDGSISRARAEVLIDGFLQAMNEKWQELNQQYLEDFEVEISKRTRKHYIDSYKQDYYVASFPNPTDKSFKLRVDFKQIAQLHVHALSPIADAIAANTRGWSKRDVLNYTSHFIQSIPYNTLNSRNAHDETGFVAPLTLFEINKGDCDTKSTALAAILRNLYPELDIKMVLIPNHAFLAVHLESNDEDTAIIYDDKEYIVIEAAGPALTPVGKSYESSLEHMQTNPGKIGRVISLLDKRPTN